LIPAVTPRYCTKKIEKCSLEHKKTKEKKHIYSGHKKYRSKSMAPDHTANYIMQIKQKFEKFVIKNKDEAIRKQDLEKNI
jgi:hypothetical protein